MATTAAPQAPARNPTHPSPDPSLVTFDSHRRRPLADKKVYRPVRRLTLSRIDEAPPRPKSHQPSTDISMCPMLRSRSNVSADTSRSVPVCDQSANTHLASTSPQYAEPKCYDSASTYDPPVSMSDPYPVNSNPYNPYPSDPPLYPFNLHPANYPYRLPAKPNNLFLAFMY